MHITLNNILCSSLDDVKRAASAEVSAFVAEYLNPSDYVIAHTSGSTPTRCSTSTCRLATSQAK